MKVIARILPLTMAALVSVHLSAQMKQHYQEADKYIVSNMWKTVASRDVKPEFIAGGDTFWYVYKTTTSTDYFILDPVRGKTSPLFDKQRLVKEISSITNNTYNISQLSVFPRFEADGKSFLLDIDGKRIRYDMRSGKCTEVQLPKRIPYKAPDRMEQMKKYSRDSLFSAYCVGHDIYVQATGGKAVRVTSDGATHNTYSDDESNAPGKLFTTKASWIGSTHMMYVLREDHRNMGKCPVVSSVNGGHPRLVSSITGGTEYAMPGDKYVTQYELSLIDADKATSRKVNLAKWKDQSVKILHHTADGRSLYLQRTRRTCDELDVLRVDVATGHVDVVLNEQCKPYFSDRMQFIRFFNNDTEFIWWSERTGWGHFYLYTADGKLKRQLTDGEWMAERIVRLDEKLRVAYFVGHGREEGVNPYYNMFYSVTLDGGKVNLLTPENAHHDITFTPSGKYFIDNYSRVDLTPASVVRNNRGRLVCRIAEADLSELYDMGWKMPEPFTVKAADNTTDLYGVMWKPFDFDPSRKYPIISYVYPGPQHEAVPFAFTTTGDHNAALAQLGFIVVCMGHRGGSPMRGLAYRTYGYGNLRDYPLADDKYAIEQLAARHSYIDLTRVGIFGHSGGGFMSATALMTYPDFYKVAVASSGNHDNNMFHQSWGETFHGVSQEYIGNDTVFKCRIPTNLELAKNLRGHLLLVTGDEDNNVHPGNTFRLVDALIKADKQFDMLVLPGQGHLYKGAAADYWRRRIWFYFAKHLLGDTTSDEYIDMQNYKK